MNYFKDLYDKAADSLTTNLILFGILEPRDAEHKERTDKAESSLHAWSAKIMFLVFLKIAIASTGFVLFD